MKSGERLIRGFRRVGIVAAVPCLIVAVIVAGYGAISEYQRSHRNDWWKNAPLAKSEPSRALTFDEFIPQKPGQPAKGPWDDYRQKEPQLVPVDHDPFAASELMPALQLAGVVAAIGAALFFGFWAIGWICAGFSREA